MYRMMIPFENVKVKLTVTHFDQTDLIMNLYYYECGLLHQNSTFTFHGIRIGTLEI